MLAAWRGVLFFESLGVARSSAARMSDGFGIRKFGPPPDALGNASASSLVGGGEDDAARILD